MNREIELRVWNKYHKKMYRLLLIDFEHSIVHCLNEDGKSTHTFGFIDIYFLQYTGLKDRNGENIFEGDLLRIPASSDWDKKNFSAFEVFYHDNDCADGHVGFQMNRMHNYGSVAGGYCGYKFLPAVTAQFEIIGNIHQLPEGTNQ